ncbi:hypothetical protein GDO78_006546 [Eleutherodactylus coqui]|uniref:receptor protein-tyrosine kinase n=1 Tax=Eleutherodactylus coqui TaxID=57060 RepID=A0A8J6FR56_ELECQ|nr:hypothetical protein GDO78_006546 [Eleutherodactylus coqui]
MGAAALTLLVLISVRDGLKNQDPEPANNEEVIQAGDAVTLKCVGNETVKWIIQGKERKPIYNDTIQILNAGYRDTRTYRCVYDSSSYTESAEVHLFVKDASNYWNCLSGAVVSFNEGQDALIPCLLTDPSIPDSAVSSELLDYSGKSLNIQSLYIDAKKGFTVPKVQTDLNGSKFKCVAKVNGIEMMNRPIKIYIQKEEILPSVSLTYKHIRIRGEDFITTCTAKSNARNSIHWENTTKKNIPRVQIEHNLLGDVWTTTSILTIQNVSFEDSGNYTCIAGNNGGSNRTSANLQVIEKAFVNVSTSQNRSISLFTGDSVQLMVDIEAYPSQLSWKWLHNNAGNTTDVSSLAKLEDKGPYRKKNILTLNRLNGNENGTYTFSVNNSQTDATLTFVIRMYMPEEFSPLMIAMTAGGIFFLLLSAFLFYKYKQKPKYDIRWQMLQVSDGNQYICIDPTQLPYNERWEFPRANLQFGKTIGAGAFGKVMEATAFGMGKAESALRVAVKMLKPSAHTDEKEALMSELKILSHLGHHENIVNLLGACTSGGPILVITEYCQHGDLLNFLRRKAENLNNTFTAVLINFTGDYKNMAVEQKYLGSDSGLGTESKDSYVDMKPNMFNMAPAPENPLAEEEHMDDHLPLDLHDLLNFSLQVAQGMSFLASKNCIHRDVAARNVLVAHGRVAKICDFGLARDIENDSNYVVKGNARLPVKWMAPESIFDCIYTVQSDVWSYGIFLWEIFSLGRSPYPGVIVNRKFYKMIKDGYKMDCPDYAPLDIYRIMNACWDLEPTRRPTFNQIAHLISRQMGLITDQDYRNIIQGQEEEDDCADTKCVDSEEPLMKGNNYQFC